MKNIIKIVMITLVLVSCKAFDKLTMFDLKYDTKFTVPKNSLVNIPIDIPSPEIETNTDEEFAANDTRKDLIEGVKLKEVTLQIENPGYTFRFLKSVQVFMRAEGLPEIKIAERVDIPDDIGNQLDMVVSGAELVEYLKKDKISMRVKTIADEPLREDLSVKAYLVFRVDAKILGI